MRMLMTELFLLTILLTGKISGSRNVMENVSVQQGRSIIIPCLYDARYKNYEKYLCFGHQPLLCTEVKSVIKEISDDQTNLIFTVTMENLTTKDTGYYWCSARKDAMTRKYFFDAMTRFHLEVTTEKATPKLYVDNQMITAYEGGHVVISCYHQQKNSNEWCKIGGPCVSTIGNISDASVELSGMDWGFRVTMSKLTINNTGWYMCSAGNQQMPVHITVQRSTPNKKRSSFAWVVILGFLLVLACIAVKIFRPHKEIAEMFSSRKRSENSYVSMKRPNLQTNQNGDEEAQEYEIMFRPGQTPGVQGTNCKGNYSDGGHITEKGHHCTC
ncbi:polymeric immunoglobulin receptor isoform X2 [Tachysurus fulvidraco]|uniref:polymeric immunoglobulin receptor isoform X2 n=1 Tax=Tachysurus fulvidraco TaxID=1234273 RepID=UPI001FED439D|nr:polymeric immunoglobulin receptor isoform X2 [Tachysurus fulvidraco]